MRNPPRVYLAATWEHKAEAADAKARLVAAGIEVVSGWTERENTPAEVESATMQEQAVLDQQEVREANTLVLLGKAKAEYITRGAFAMVPTSMVDVNPAATQAKRQEMRQMLGAAVADSTTPREAWETITGIIEQQKKNPGLFTGGGPLGPEPAAPGAIALPAGATGTGKMGVVGGPPAGGAPEIPLPSGDVAKMSIIGGPPAGGPELHHTAGDDTAGPVNFDDLLDRLRQKESGGGVHLVSPRGALGPYQILPSTAAEYGFSKNEIMGEDGGRRASETILRDFYRRSKVRNLWTTLFSALTPADDEDADPLETIDVEDLSHAGKNPQKQLEQSQVIALIEKEIEKLPARQS